MSDINFKQIQFYVLGIFTIIIGLLIWFLNTDFFVKKDYLDFKKTEFKATLFSKKDEHPTKGNKIYLKNGPELIVRRELFDKLKIGDSIIKKADSDSIFFKTDFGVLIDDYNGFKKKIFGIIKIKTTYNTGYSSLLLTFLSESPRKFAIFGLRRKILADFHATKP